MIISEVYYFAADAGLKVAATQNLFYIGSISD